MMPSNRIWMGQQLSLLGSLQRYNGLSDQTIYSTRLEIVIEEMARIKSRNPLAAARKLGSCKDRGIGAVLPSLLAADFSAPPTARLSLENTGQVHSPSCFFFSIVPTD
jgi:hypothetical protein